MKKITFLMFFALIISCKEDTPENESVETIPEEKSIVDSEKMIEDIKFDLTDETESFFSNVRLGLINEQEVYPSTFRMVDLQNELIALFDPKNFICDCDAKLVKKLKEHKNSKNNKLGFVPLKVLSNVQDTKAYKVDEQGSNMLANGFSYIDKNGKKSILLYAKDSPTAIDFDASNYFEEDATNFYYSIDCSGFLSAAISAVGGVGDNAIQSSANGALKSDTSLVVIYGVMYSPLYYAYEGSGEFNSKEKTVIRKRIDVLNSILKKIPNYDLLDNTIINLNTNYKVLLSSNKGESSFNGDVKASGSGSVGFGFGSVKGSAGAGVNIVRKSEFNRFDTYVIRPNIASLPDKINVKSLKDLIAQLEIEYNSI